MQHEFYRLERIKKSSWFYQKSWVLNRTFENQMQFYNVFFTLTISVQEVTQWLNLLKSIEIQPTIFLIFFTFGSKKDVVPN